MTFSQWDVRVGVTAFVMNQANEFTFDSSKRSSHDSNLGELRWYAGCHFPRDMSNGLLTISQTSCSEKNVEKFGVVSSWTIPAVVDLKLEELEKDEPEGDWPFREVVGSLMRLASQTRPDSSNVVRAVARYAHAPKSMHWKAPFVFSSI